MKNDYPGCNRYGLSDSGSINMNNMSDYLDKVMYYILIVLIMISVLLFLIIRRYGNKRISVKNNSYKSLYIIEILLVILPSVILILISIPSIWLLYSNEELIEGLITIKIIGVQWYWRYILNDILNNEIIIDSYTLNDDNIELFRLIEVDNKLLLPYRKSIRLILTSVDVILSFSIPSLGLKCDCIPNRINYSTLYILRPSFFIGLCTELCGNGHSNMNIVLESVDNLTFFNWLFSYIIN